MVAIVLSCLALSPGESSGKSRPRRPPAPVAEPTPPAPTPGTVAAAAAEDPQLAALLGRLTPEGRAKLERLTLEEFDAAFAAPEHQRSFAQDEIVQLVSEVETLADRARGNEELEAMLAALSPEDRARAGAMPMTQLSQYTELPRDQVPADARAILDAMDVAFAGQFERTLSYQTGTIPLAEAGATLEIGDGFRFLGPADAERVLTEAWGNPKSTTRPLGMIVPEGAPVNGEGGFGVIVTYIAEGHVEDDDADDIDYDELLQEMKASSKEESAARRAAGLPSLDLVGWAQPPRYDDANHRLYWARELETDVSPVHVLNYDVRILGRKGVLSLNAIGDMGQLDTVGPAMESLLASVTFETGHRYDDFDPDLDEVAAYGIGGLIAGKVAMKAGLLAGLLKGLIAAKKLVIVLFAGAGAAVVGWFRRRRGEG
jgi:uncharacterized membrane-anchored protein